MKIVVFEFEDWEAPYFDQFQNDHEIIFESNPLDEGIISRYADADIISTFVYSTLSRTILEKLPQLKFIATRSTGFDHIDIDYCQIRSIQVSNVPIYGESTVAEHVFALLLAISHKIPEAVNRTRHGDFSQEGLQGFDLCGKTIGIIGTGNIGKRTSRIAKGFAMDVVAYDINRDIKAAKEIGFVYVSLSELLKKSDIISLHIPGNKNTLNFLSKSEFQIVKEGVIVINTARGNVIDINSLLEALTSQKVAAAGLDVLPDETLLRSNAKFLHIFSEEKSKHKNLLANHILLRMKNVIITPHNAYNTKEAIQRILETTIKNINGFCVGKAINLISTSD